MMRILCAAAVVGTFACMVPRPASFGTDADGGFDAGKADGGSPSHVGGPCQGSSDCEGIDAGGVCVPESVVDGGILGPGGYCTSEPCDPTQPAATCGPDSVCGNLGGLTDGGSCEAACNTDHDCRVGFRCVENGCIPTVVESTSADGGDGGAGGPDSGCGDTQNDSQNCGSCGNVCMFAHSSAACHQGVCALSACDPGYENCDGDSSTGCETDLTDDSHHCGSCGNACNGGDCVEGTCTVPDAGPPDAGPGIDAGISCSGTVCGGGVCVDTFSDPGNCGACGHSCGSLSCCNGVCSDITSDPNNCASCGHSCGGGTCCHSACFDTTRDPANCGGCGNQCPHGCCNSVCTDLLSDSNNCGACGRPCTSGRTCCNAYCADLTTDDLNCGACGFLCDSLSCCAASYCSVLNCF